MTTRLRYVGICLVFLFGIYVLVVQSTWTHADDRAKGAKEEPLKAVAASVLGGEDRYLTHLSTDKPIYRPGETLRARAVVLHQETNKPLMTNPVPAMVEVVGPKGDRLASGMAQRVDGVVGFRWDVPRSLPGGQYTIRVSSPFLGDPPAERTFDIRAYRAPRLKSQIKFLRDGYGPGDEALATLHVERAEGGVPKGAEVTVIARVDGSEVFRGKTSVGANGKCLARFPLPKQIRRGEGTLSLVIKDGGVVETASKTIPILLQTVDLTMYAEGGDLIAGQESRIYFEALTPAKKPADLAGVVVDDRGKEVATFRSEHDGRGRFRITPLPGRSYELRVTKPAGIKTRFPLPPAKMSGVVLSAKSNTFTAKQPIELSVHSTHADYEPRVTLSKRERIIATARPAAKNGIVKFDLTNDDPAGVLIATVWDRRGMPLAERLVFREPADTVRIKITSGSRRYVPGGTARLTLETTDSRGEPISALVGLTVTDDSVQQMIDRREQAPRLPVMVLLENDVRNLADAHVYLDSNNSQAPLAVDLLLGTQGWRRFALIDPARFAQEFGDKGLRVLAMRTPPQPRLAGFGGQRRRAFLNENKRIVEVPFGDDANIKPAKASRPPAAKPPAAKPQAAARPSDALARERVNGFADADRAELQQAAAGIVAPNFGAGAGGFGRFRPAVGNDMQIERLYAHQVRPNRQPNERIDFTETIYWNAGIRTDERGRAEIEFGLNDSITSFAVLADGFTTDGRLGSGAIKIDSVEPFYVEPKLPLEVTAGDRIRLPVAAINSTDRALRAKLAIQTDESLQLTSQNTVFDVPADTRSRQVLDLLVGSANGSAKLTLTAKAGSYLDSVARQIIIKPAGFPIELAGGGLIGPGDRVSRELVIPADVVAGSVQTRIVAYPTPLGSLTESLKGLIRQPGGCFEQTSSTVYPLVMAQQYFQSHHGVDPSLIEKSSQILETGYQRLLGFECKGHGFEWFGRDPGHDALTAYGLMEFTDMSQVRHVDPAMLDRTRDWLLKQRDGKGGYVRKTRTLHTWLADPEIANSYNTWAMLKAGVKADLTHELDWIREAADKSSNTYVVALAANVLAMAGDKDGANRLLDRLVGYQESNGALSGATRSVVGSGGEALKIETTALAVTAWLTNSSYKSNVEKSIEFIAESCKSGRFGSTQSTVLALQAIVAYDNSRARPKAGGALQLIVDGKPVGSSVKFDKDTEGAIELPPFADQLLAGKHQIQLQMNDGSQMPFSWAVEFHRLKPDSAQQCKVHLEVDLRDAKLEEGSVTEAKVVVTNRSNEDVPNPIAIVGIPGGLEVRHDQLKELVKADRIAAYEVVGREVILYWRIMKAEQRVELPISLVAAIPGTYTGPASRAYLYYTDEFKEWVGGLRVEIAVKDR